MRLLVFVVVAFLSRGHGQHAHTYFGYITGGTGQDNDAIVPNIETIVMPYKRLTQGGHVHGFRIDTYLAGQPYVIQIWRRKQGYWTDGVWQNLPYNTPGIDTLNGNYTMVYSTTEIHSNGGTEYHYLENAVRVQENDFLGFSFKHRSPFRYGVDDVCTSTNQYTHNKKRISADYPQQFIFYSFDADADRSTTECRTYRFGMLIEYADDDCFRLNAVNLNSQYSFQSHPLYPASPYTDNMDVCWIIHSYDDDHYLTFTLDSNEEFDIEYYHQCGYDKITFFKKSGDTFDEFGDSYCDAVQFPYTNEIYERASIVKVTFVTDDTRTAAGFKFYFSAVATDYDPTSGNSNPNSGASSNNNNKCDDNGDEWRWKCLSTAEKVLLICVIILLFICIVLFLFCVIWYCCCRTRDKVEPEKYDEVDNVVLPHKVDNTNAIPYDYEPYYTPKPYTPVYGRRPQPRTYEEPPTYEEPRTYNTYGQPKSLRSISEPLGADGQKAKYEYTSGQRY